MLKLADQDIKILHLEPTDACNAACPQCARETDSNFDKNTVHQLSVEQITQLIDDNLIGKLDKMFMCGTYGDPAAGKSTLDIYRYFREINPTITLGMNTNGGLRDVNWWTQLAGLLNQTKDYVVFSIDGLSDTNHIYRANVNWNKVIENAKAFIDAGGSAHWDMLVFDHNNHQVDQAESLAKKMGFKWFRAKVSKRFNSHPVDFLNPPKGWRDPIVTEGKISCQALIESSVYISAKGIIHPCCWVGSIKTATLDQFSFIQDSWTTEQPYEICKNTCTKNVSGTSFTNQWQREIEFQ
jgi:sulfatase maturation enzyme AslB (radical SAM superfamily)